MSQTVEQVLTAATDSVDLINGVNAGTYKTLDMSQEEINNMVQMNIDHLELILTYEPADEDDDTPDVVGDSSDKSSYTDAIATGLDYITAH